MTKICIPIVEKTSAKVIKLAEQAKAAKADLVEIWLGEIENPDIPGLFKGIPLPVLVNCKGHDEKGAFAGTEEEKIRMLIEAAKAGAAYVDLNYKCDGNLLTELQVNKGKSKLILSAHFWNGTPGLPHLTGLLAKILEKKPDVVKFAAKPNSFRDVVTMIRLAEKLSSKNIPHIVISMGKRGKVTRIASPLLGNEIMFGTSEDGKESAPGQIGAKRLSEFFKEW